MNPKTCTCHRQAQTATKTNVFLYLSCINQATYNSVCWQIRTICIAEVMLHPTSLHSLLERSIFDIWIRLQQAQPVDESATRILNYTAVFRHHTKRNNTYRSWDWWISIRPALFLWKLVKRFFAFAFIVTVLKYLSTHLSWICNIV
jgi:hypothetical protein